MDLEKESLKYQKWQYEFFSMLNLFKCETIDCCNIDDLKCRIKQIFAEVTRNNEMNLTELYVYLQTHYDIVKSVNIIYEMCKCDKIKNIYSFYIVPQILALLEMCKTSLFIFYSSTEIRNEMKELNVSKTNIFNSNETYLNEIDFLIYDVLSSNISIISAIETLESYCRSDNMIIDKSGNITYSKFGNMPYCKEKQKTIDQLVVVDGVEIYKCRTVYFRIMLQSILFIFYYQNNLNKPIFIYSPTTDEKSNVSSTSSTSMHILKYLHKKYGKDINLIKLDE